MWILFGIGVIITAIAGVICFVKQREAKWFRFASLSLTALTLCAFFSQVANWAQAEDWSAMIDVVPTLSTLLWVLTVLSILLNSISLFAKKQAKTN